MALLFKVSFYFLIHHIQTVRFRVPLRLSSRTPELLLIIWPALPNVGENFTYINTVVQGAKFISNFLLNVSKQLILTTETGDTIAEVRVPVVKQESRENAPTGIVLKRLDDITEIENTGIKRLETEYQSINDTKTGKPKWASFLVNTTELEEGCVKHCCCKSHCLLYHQQEDQKVNH